MSDGLLARRGRDGALRVRYPYLLPDLYAELNGRFWNGDLPPALRSDPMRFQGPIGALSRYVILRRVSMISDPTRRARRGLRGSAGPARGIFVPPRPTWPAQIRLAAPLDPDQERPVLLHEMIHCGLWFAGFTKESHGPRFVAELERLAAEGETWASEAAEQYREHPSET